MPWQLLTPTEREREYSPSSCIGGNYQRFIDAYASESAAAITQTQAQGARWSQLQYGSKSTQTLHLCVPNKKNINNLVSIAAATDASLPPLLVFIHGGYWQELSAKESLFPATSCAQHGAAFAAIDYTLAPQASVTQMVAECKQALAYLSSSATALGFDATRIVVTGSSAGAHLAAMVAHSQVGYTLRGAVLVSGIYELEPLIGTSINGALCLDAGTARAISPSLLPALEYPSAIVCYGAVETKEFKRQSQQFAQHLRDESPANQAITEFEIPGRNHFDVIMELTDTNTVLGQKVLSVLFSLRTV